MGIKGLNDANCPDSILTAFFKVWHYSRQIGSILYALEGLTSLISLSNCSCKLLLTVKLLCIYLYFIALMVEDAVKTVF